MRLEPFCRFSMRYESASWQQPYGSGEDSEWVGFGHGDGKVEGGLEGEIFWANYPRRREDGAWMPNARGVIRTTDGSEILVSMHGQSVKEDAPGFLRAIVMRIELTTEAEQHRWLNTAFLVGEGEINEDVEELWIDTFVCVNELAQGPPAIGAKPPERFRLGVRRIRAEDA
jgi:Protein of unknown function (DUF3237)